METQVRNAYRPDGAVDEAAVDAALARTRELAG